MLDVSSKEDVSSGMAIKNPILLEKIDEFLSETGLSESYVGKMGAGNSEVVGRLRSGGRVWPETEAKLRSFMLVYLEKHRAKKHVSSREDIQEASRNVSESDAA